MFTSLVAPRVFWTFGIARTNVIFEDRTNASWVLSSRQQTPYSKLPPRTYQACFTGAESLVSTVDVGCARERLYGVNTGLTRRSI